jgi:hypothetical protein
MFLARTASLLFWSALIGMAQPNTPLTITTASPLPPAAIGVNYSQLLAATGGTAPYLWTLSFGELPSGLLLSSAGAITGTPASTGTSGFTVRVTDSASATTTQTYGITVIAPGPQTRFGAMSQIAAGGSWDTTITLVNTSSVPVAIAVVFRADDGSALSLPLRLTQQGSARTSTASSANALLNPNATVLIGTGPLPNTIVGWADVLSSGPVSGYAIMRSAPANDKPSEATVPLQTAFPTSVLLPYDNTAGYVMGLALSNLAVGPATVNATIWDESGSQLGTQPIAISGNGHLAFALPDKLPLTTGRRGMVQLQSTSGGIAGLGLRFSPAGPFTDVPVVLQQ